jgi:hypothetical protein
VMSCASGLLETLAAAPLEDLGPITGDKIAPGRLVGRVAAEPGQESDAGGGRMVPYHMVVSSGTPTPFRPLPNPQI